MKAAICTAYGAPEVLQIRDAGASVLEQGGSHPFVCDRGDGEMTASCGA